MTSHKEYNNLVTDLFFGHGVNITFFALVGFEQFANHGAFVTTFLCLGDNCINRIMDGYSGFTGFTDFGIHIRQPVWKPKEIG